MMSTRVPSLSPPAHEADPFAALQCDDARSRTGFMSGRRNRNLLRSPPLENSATPCPYLVEVRASRQIPSRESRHVRENRSVLGAEDRPHGDSPTDANARPRRGRAPVSR
jgi:hypothetical protein